jgi:energy-coupling factor transporter ATP-binding protein EcfA2
MRFGPLKACESSAIAGTPHVASVFVEGICATPGGRSFQVDFFLSLSWKGLPYLSVDAVLQASQPRQAGNIHFFVPSPVHEAIISLLTSLIIGGRIKEKYFPQVQRRFADNRCEVIAALLPQFGVKAVTRLVDSVIGGDRQKIHACVRSLRTCLALRSLLCKPIRSACSIVRHYAGEGEVRYSPRTIETVCILGPSGCGKTTIIENLIPLLQSSAKIVEKHHFKSRLTLARKSRRMNSRSDGCAQAQSGSLSSMAKALVWLLDEWLSQFIGKKNFTLRICGCSCQDLLIDPAKYGYNGPQWFARLASRFFPSPDLWILLDPAMRTEGGELPAQTARQIEAYRSFVKARKQHIILNAGKPAADLTEDVYAAIIDMLAQSTDRQLKRRFCALDAAVGDEERAGCRE